MNTASEARELGQKVANLLKAAEIDPAFEVLYPVISQRTHFRLLDIVAEQLSTSPRKSVNKLIDLIVETHLEGGWVVIATLLAGRFSQDVGEALERAAACIRKGAAWYVTDIFGERVVGQAFVTNLPVAQQLLAPWRSDPDARIRRAIGVGCHFWIKRTHGRPDLVARARQVLDYLTPMLEDQDDDAVKGVGWALKTTGKFYPDLLIEYLHEQLVIRNRQVRPLMTRKAFKFLDDSQRQRVLAKMP